MCRVFGEVFWNYFLPNKFLELLLPGRFITRFSHLCHLFLQSSLSKNTAMKVRKKNNLPVVAVLSKKLDTSTAPDQVQLFKLSSKFLQSHSKETDGNNKRWRARYSANRLLQSMWIRSAFYEGNIGKILLLVTQLLASPGALFPSLVAVPMLPLQLLSLPPTSRSWAKVWCSAGSVCHHGPCSELTGDSGTQERTSVLLSWRNAKGTLFCRSIEFLEKVNWSPACSRQATVRGGRPWRRRSWAGSGMATGHRASCCGAPPKRGVTVLEALLCWALLLSPLQHEQLPATGCQGILLLWY